MTWSNPYKPHIAMLQSGTGSWGVFAPRPRPHIIGWNNTFRTFSGACEYAQQIMQPYLTNTREA